MACSGEDRDVPLKKSEVPALEVDALAWILGVQDSGEFVGTHLGKAWLHARAEDPERFAELLSLGQLDEILGTFGIRHPGIRLVRSDDDIPPSEYVWRDNIVDPAQVARLFAEGATVIFGALHDRHEGMCRLCSEVTRQVSARSQTNIYLTPPSSQGFKPHWDTHDVFVLQVEGSKIWRMYAGGPKLPLQDQKFDPELHAPGAVEAEFRLEAGDALYVPRGVMHAAATTDAISLHITLGVMAYTWCDLLVDCLGELAGRATEWRENVPFGFARRADDSALRARLDEMLTGLGGEVDLPKVVVERQRAFESRLRPRTRDLLRRASAAAAVAKGDTLEWRRGAHGWIEQRNGRVALVTGGREVEFPVGARRTLELLLGGEPVTAGAMEDGLDWESRRVVLTTLIREGLLASDAPLPESSV